MFANDIYMTFRTIQKNISQEIYKIFDQFICNIFNDLRHDIFKQMSENGVIIGLAFMMAASIAIFNVCGIMTTKYASAAQRSTIDTSRTLIIWIMSCLLKLETFEW